MDQDDKPLSSYSGPSHAGLYEKAVQSLTETFKPSLHKITQDFVAKSIAENAPDNSRYARIIEFEIRRRGDGAGLTQDFAEPLLWTGIKTVAAVGIAVLGESLEKGKFKMVGYSAAVGLILNNAVELCRLMPRYRSGLQGSLEMAKDRWKAIEETGIDPFSSQSKTREINKESEHGAFADTIGSKADVMPMSLMQQAEKRDSLRQK